MIMNYAKNTDSKLIEIYHTLARKLTNYNHCVAELTDNEKISKMSAKLELKLIKGEMSYRHLPILNLGYKL